MTPLRQKMIDAMLVRGLAVRIQRSYLDAVTQLAKHYRCSPETLSTAQLQDYFLYLVDEVARLLATLENMKHRVLLTTCYGCGLRVSELVALQVRDIDGERSLLRVTQGKGGKDRQVPMPPTLLLLLRRYWCVFHPETALFYGRDPTTCLSIETAQRVFQAAKQKAGINKVGGIHSLRHAYATHQLAAGMPLHQLKQMLGHNYLHSTLRYLHWVPQVTEGLGTDLVAGLEVGHG
jgi:integrase/recombinase XerD